MSNMTFRYEIADDREGRKYHKCYSGKRTDSVVSVGRANVSLKGEPRIFIRTGQPSIRDQLVFDFLVDRSVRPDVSPKFTKHDSIEFYMPVKEGIAFLEYALQTLKKHVE